LSRYELVTPASIGINESHRERDLQKSFSADKRVDTIVKDANLEPHLLSDKGKPQNVLLRGISGVV